MLVKTSFLNPNFVCDVSKAESIVANALKKILCFFKSSSLSALDFQGSSLPFAPVCQIVPVLAIALLPKLSQLFSLCFSFFITCLLSCCCWYFAYVRLRTFMEESKAGRFWVTTEALPRKGE